MATEEQEIAAFDLVATIARMTPYGEEYGDDAREAMDSLIRRAREIVADKAERD
jgi:hypothetical protein